MNYSSTFFKFYRATSNCPMCELAGNENYVDVRYNTCSSQTSQHTRANINIERPYAMIIRDRLLTIYTCTVVRRRVQSATVSEWNTINNPQFITSSVSRDSMVHCVTHVLSRLNAVLPLIISTSWPIPGTWLTMRLVVIVTHDYH